MSVAAARARGGASLGERYESVPHAWEERGVDRVLRSLDILLAGAGLTVLSPLMAVVAGVIRVTSGRPLLYRGPRVGQAGEVFTMYKFRTLSPGAEARLGPYYGPELTLRTEEETTPVGRVLRLTHLDEAPQLVNVLKGDMSMVGPRPIRPRFFEELIAEIPEYWQRLVVPPGVTGLAQLRLTREMSWREKLAHDFEYIADRSVPLYLSVLLGTVSRLRG